MKKYLEKIQEVGTPVYIYDREIIRTQYYKLKNSLPEDFNILYAVKANPNKEVIGFLQSLGAGADIASSGELKRVLDCHYPSELITFAGPGKTEDEIRLAIQASCAAINVESIDELNIIEECAESLSKRANICVRINPLQSSQRGGLHMGGGVTQFGIAEEDLSDFFSHLEKCKNINFQGIHVFVGSQILDEKVLLENFTTCFDLALRMQTEFKKEISLINFGGGFGIPYFPHEKELDLVQFKKELEEIADHYRDFFPAARFFVESGRFLVGLSGFYITKVLYKKKSRGTKFVIIDGGMHHNIAASGQLGSSLKRNYDLRILNKLDEPLMEKVTIAGSLCTPMDVLARNIDVPFIERGDYVCILNSGAYGYSLSPLFFLSHTLPKEILI